MQATLLKPWGMSIAILMSVMNTPPVLAEAATPAAIEEPPPQLQAVLRRLPFANAQLAGRQDHQHRERRCRRQAEMGHLAERARKEAEDRRQDLNARKSVPRLDIPVKPRRQTPPPLPVPAKAFAQGPRP